TLTFSGINISGFTSLNFSGFFAEDDDGSNEDWDGNSQVKVEYAIDGGLLTEIFRIESSSTGTNSEPRVDTDFDGLGDGTEITDAFQAFSAAIAGTGSTLDLVITISNLNDGDEDIALDDIRVTGVSATNPTVGFSTATSSFAEGDAGSATQTVSVELSNYQGSAVEVTITDAGTGSATDGGTDYSFSTQVLTFTGNGTQTVDVTIVGDTDVESDETVDLDLAVTSGTADLGTDAHTLTITNDDMEPVFAFLNEIHYDNAGGDVGEFVEVAVSTDFAGSLSDLVVFLYNGSGGAFYDSHDLSTFTAGTTAGGYTFYSKAIDGIQNGPDGFALSDGGTLVEFLSYEGSFAATDGPASGVTSTDIGVSETSSTAAGQSLQRVGTCTTNCPTGLTWDGPKNETPGDINDAQFLPVELIGLAAFVRNAEVELKFSTASEQNNSHFLIQRSADGRTFSDIGRLEGQGNSEQEVGYRFVDTKPLAGFSYYRIQQIDFDGTSEFFGPVSVRFEGKDTYEPQIWPVPAQDVLQIDFLDSDQEWTVQLYNVAGQLLLERVITDKSTRTTLNLQQLPAGTYILRSVSANQQHSQKFIKK
ncbi:MAG: T9SS type A sorting domain-containing protein, partial [Bacteroidota bacterium]